MTTNKAANQNEKLSPEQITRNAVMEAFNDVNGDINGNIAELTLQNEKLVLQVDSHDQLDAAHKKLERVSLYIAHKDMNNQLDRVVVAPLPKEPAVA